MIKGIIRNVWGALFDHSRAHEVGAHNDEHADSETQKRLAEQRRANIQRRIRAIELMYDSQSRAPDQDRW